MVRAGESMAPTLLGLNGWPRRRRLLIASTVDAGRSWESSSRWRQEVRFWHLADMLTVAACPLSGVKRTSLTLVSTSANDPKRTFLAPSQALGKGGQLRQRAQIAAIWR